jgi:hypothetical protein
MQRWSLLEANEMRIWRWRGATLLKLTNQSRGGPVTQGRLTFHLPTVFETLPA